VKALAMFYGSMDSPGRKKAIMEELEKAIMKGQKP
jgi:hypothetical protein